MTNTDMARPAEQALVSDQARAGLDPTGFDPSRVLDEGRRRARSISFDWSERMRITDLEIEAALYATVPGGAPVWAWLPQKDGWTPHQTAFDVIRSAIAAVDKYRARDSDGNPKGGNAVPSRSDDSAGLKGIAETPADLSSRDTNNG